jgi:hypothetical protein
MYEIQYVISIVRNHDKNGKALLNPSEYYPEFVAQDDSIDGFPYFSESSAREFPSVAAAEKWWKWARPYLLHHMEKYCDEQTLCIHEKFVSYKPVKLIKHTEPRRIVY